MINFLIFSLEFVGFLVVNKYGHPALGIKFEHLEGVARSSILGKGNKYQKVILKS